MLNTFIKKILGLCYYLPHALLIAPIIVYLYLMINEQYGLMLKGLPIFVSLVIVSIILLKNKIIIFESDEILCRDLTLPEKYTISRLSKVFGIVLSVAFVWILVTDTRDVLYILFIIVLYSIIVLQIFAKDSGKRFTPLILIELMAVFAFQIFSTQFTHAYYYGSTDVPVHLNWIQTIVETGYVESILGGYVNYCLFHIDTVIASLLSGLDTYTSLYITATPFVIVSTVFIYYIAKHFTKSQQLSLLASFFYLMIPVIIQYATYPMPRMHSTVAFFIILYCIFRYWKELRISHLILALSIMLYMVLVHHAQLIPVALMMTGIFIFLLIYRYRFTLMQKLTLGSFYLISIIGLLVGPYGLTWLSKYMENILHSIPTVSGDNPEETVNSIIGNNVVGSSSAVENIAENVIIESSESAGSIFTQTHVSESLDSLNQLLVGEYGIGAWFSCISTAIMLVFILFGVYYLLSPKIIDKKIAVFGMFGIALTIVFSPCVMEIIEMYIGTDLMLSRLRLVMSPIFAIIMCVGCLVIGNLRFTKKSDKDDNNLKRVILVTILCIALVVASPVLAGSRDSTVFDGLLIADTNYFSETELSSFNIISEYIPAESSAYTDNPTERYFPNSEKYLNYNMPFVSLKDGGNILFVQDNINKINVDYTFLRNDRFEQSGLQFIDSSGKSNIIYPNNENERIFLKNIYTSEIVYTNDDVIIYKIQ